MSVNLHERHTLKPSTLSPCIATHQVEISRDFYVQHFDAKVVFDCGWYVSLQFGGKNTSLQFMAPQADQVACNPAGLTYNFCVDDVDVEHRTLVAKGVPITLPIADHPWGDRGFAVTDPNGITLYIYAEREPSAEFAPYRKE